MTVLSQANSYLILRIVNPNDQKYIRDVVETMGEEEARSLPNLNTGEALLSGLFTRIPVMVHVEKSVSEGSHEEEDFLAYADKGKRPELAAEAKSAYAPARRGARWTEEEDARVRTMYDSRENFDAIALALSRTRMGVIERLRGLGYEID